MPPLTAKQLLDLALQYIEMAKAVEERRLTNPNPDLKSRAQNLRAAAIDLSSSAILTTLAGLTPHYDAMLATVRDLKQEIAAEQEITRMLAFADAALNIASGALAGNPIMVITALAKATALLS